jgi:hypothetical protein
MVWIGPSHHVRWGETMMVVVPVVHCVAEDTRPAQAACSLAVYLDHISYLSVWKI